MPTVAEPKKGGVTEADIQKEIEGAQKKAASQKPTEGSLQDFASKFSAAPQPDGSIKVGEAKKAPDDNDDPEPKPPAKVEPKKPDEKKPSYIKTLETERDALRAQTEELTGKIKEMEEKISSAKTPDEFSAALAERDKAVAEREERLAKLSEENARLKERVTLYDLTEDPVYVETYVRPIERASGEIMEMLNGQPALVDMITQVAALNSGMHNTKSDEDRRRFRDQRDELVGQIADQLPSFRKDMFISSIRDLFSSTEKQVKAIQNHAQTFQQVKEKNAELQQQAAKKVAEVWQGAFSEVSSTVEKQIAIPEEVSKYIQANQIDADATPDEKLAEAAIKDGAKDYQPKDVARLFKQGAAYKKLIAHTTALQKMLDEARATISELKGSNTDGNPGRPPGGDKPTSDQQAGAFFSKFQPR